MAEEQDNQPNPVGPEPKKSKKLLILIIAVVLIAALGGGYFVWQRSGPSAPTGDAEGEGVSHVAADVHAFVALDTFIVNLAGGDGREFLRVGIELGVAGEDSGGHEEAEVPAPQIRDTILSVLTTWEADELLTVEGKERLKTDLLHALTERLGHLGVQEVYFNEFLVQR